MPFHATNRQKNNDFISFYWLIETLYASKILIPFLDLRKKKKFRLVVFDISDFLLKCFRYAYSKFTLKYVFRAKTKYFAGILVGSISVHDLQVMDFDLTNWSKTNRHTFRHKMYIFNFTMNMIGMNFFLSFFLHCNCRLIFLHNHKNTSNSWTLFVK